MLWNKLAFFSFHADRNAPSGVNPSDWSNTTRIVMKSVRADLEPRYRNAYVTVRFSVRIKHEERRTLSVSRSHHIVVRYWPLSDKALT